MLGLVVALALQFRATRYRAPVYWSAVLMVAVFGTMVADGLHDGAGIPYAVEHADLRRRRGGWSSSSGTAARARCRSTASRPAAASSSTGAVLATFALGTAAGDLTAFTLNLGFFGSVVLFAAAIAVPRVALVALRPQPDPRVLGRLRRHAPARRIVRRLVRQAARTTGLGLGDGPSARSALLVFVGLVAYTAAGRRDVQEATSGRRRHYRQRGLD